MTLRTSMTVGEAAREVGRILDEFAAPILVALVIAVASLAAFAALRAYEDAQIRRVLDIEGRYLAGAMAAGLEQRVLAIRGLARQWETVAAPDSDRWAADARALMAQDAVVRGVEWRDAEFGLRWSTPITAKLPNGDLDPETDPDRVSAAAIVAVHAEGSVAGSFPGARGGRNVVFAAPMTRDGRREGVLTAVTRARDLIDTIVAAEARRGFSIAVREGPYRVYGPMASAEGPEAELWWRSTVTQVGDLQWVIEYWPSVDLMDGLRSLGPAFVLVGGLLLAAMMAGMVRTRELSLRGRA